MRELIIGATALAFLLLTTSAIAQEEEGDEGVAEFGSNVEEGLVADEDNEKRDQGYLGELTMGFRSGYALPFGKDQRDADGVPIGDIYVGQIPVWLDIGYEPLPNLVLGGYGQWGPIVVADADPNDPEPGGCPRTATCFGHAFRGGPQIHWQFGPKSALNPWVGLGVAYEFAWRKVKEGDTTRKRLYRGPELINVQAGLDIKPKEELGIGPFVSFSVDRFTDCKDTINGSPGARCDIEKRAQHMWLLAGARIYFSAIQVKKRGVDLDSRK